MALDSIEGALLARLRRLGRALRYHELERLEPYGVTPEQVRLLIRLQDRDGLGQSELVDPTFDDRANITHLVNQLERARLVERRPDEGDGRRRRVWLTSTGRGLLARLEGEGRLGHADLLASFDDVEIRTLTELVRRIEHALTSTRS